MTTKHDGGPAFPFGHISEVTGQPVNGFYDPGMSLRDWFAGLAMQGLFAAQVHGFIDSPAKGPFASMAYEMADAMLSQRENT